MSEQPAASRTSREAGMLMRDVYLRNTGPYRGRGPWQALRRAFWSGLRRPASLGRCVNWYLKRP